MQPWFVGLLLDQPEVFRILNEYEGHIDCTSDDSQHQDQNPVNQKKFQNDIQNLLAVFELLEIFSMK